MDIISGRIYKPDRLMYYIQPTAEEKHDYLHGKLPAAIAAYDGAFGTYDCPGLFIIKDGESMKEVLGIEFRPNDERIQYPQDLPSIMLPGGFLVSGLLMDDDNSKEKISSAIEELQNNIGSVFFHGYTLRAMPQPDLIQIFTLNKSHRIMVQVQPVSAEDFFTTPTPSTETEKRLYNSAYRDSLTGHYNWSYLWPVIAGYGLKGIQDFSFVHFDVKDFNAVNIVYGHDTANKVLSRIVEHMNEMDWIYYSARCDNDNFAMMIKDMPEEETRQKLLEFFDGISALNEDKNYRIYYRCGVVPMRNTLLLGDRVADAGKQVQRLGTKAYETEVLFYTDEMHDRLDWSVKLKTYLDTAIKNDEFLVYLQPKYKLDTETLHGAEALIRWRYHNRELLSPGLFVPIFETGGLISKLDDIVLKKVCAQLKEWEEDGLPLYPVSVNLSRKSIGKPELAKHLTEIVDSYGVDHSLIDFELTESANSDNQEQMVEVITQLKENGFKISMDDFGTGYSSLSLLTSLPIDTIKIDKSFVDKISDRGSVQNSRTMLRHIITMVRGLDFTCLAEGAETKEQIDLLREFGCEIVQGYYYSRPLPVEDYEKLLKSEN